MYSTLTHSTHPNTDNTAFHTALIEKESNNLVATATINRNVATTTPKATTATTITTTAIIFEQQQILQHTTKTMMKTIL